MAALYLAADPLEAEILRSYLAEHGVAVRVLGGFAWGGRGELPADAWPRLELADARDAERARELIRRYERGRHAHAQWRCGCGESSPVTFETCWQCGAERAHDGAVGAR